MAGQPSKPAPKEDHGLGVKSYLFLYNGVQVAGWFYLLSQTITHYLQGGTTGNLWPAVGTTLLYFQNAAVIEVVNVMLGYVRSPLLITLMQVASRVMVVSALLYPMPPVQTSYGLPLIIAAWSVTEIVRYSFYALNIINAVPYFLVWCRYTFFYALYPIGVSGELILYYTAQQFVGQTKMATYELPNALNFIFNFRYLLIGIMLIYIPQFPQLFGYMLNQRKKVIGGGSTSSQKSKKKN